MGNSLLSLIIVVVFFGLILGVLTTSTIYLFKSWKRWRYNKATYGRIKPGTATPIYREYHKTFYDSFTESEQANMVHLPITEGRNNREGIKTDS